MHGLKFKGTVTPFLNIDLINASFNLADVATFRTFMFGPMLECHRLFEYFSIPLACLNYLLIFTCNQIFITTNQNVQSSLSIEGWDKTQDEQNQLYSITFDNAENNQILGPIF